MTLLKFNGKDLTNEWTIDSKITIDMDNTVSSEIMRISNLHEKYMRYMYEINKNHDLLTKRYNKLKLDKYYYYQESTHFTKEELDQRGWDYDPYDGKTKPKTKELKDLYFKVDKHLGEIEDDIKELETMKEILGYIMKHFNNYSFVFNHLKGY